MSDYAARPVGNVRPPRGRGAGRGKFEGASKTQERILSISLAVVASLALVAIGLLVLPPLLRITRYEISGNATMTRGEVLSSALIHDREYFFSLDVARVESALETDPRVESAKAWKLFPNGLEMVVRERRAVAEAVVSLEGRPAVVSIDAEGVAFARAGQEAASSVPVLSGIRFEGFRLGTRLPPAFAELLASLGEIQASEPALLAAISEIRVVTAAPPGGATYGPAIAELVIYPLNQHIPVRASASLDASSLRSIILVLDVLGTRGIAASVQEIDFRTGTVVFRSKEGQSG
jgi:cell division protein FtsQ